MKISTIFAGLSGIVFTLMTTYSCMPVSSAVAFSDTCPSQAVADMNAQFGASTSTLTTCLQNLNKIKVVIAWNDAVLNKRSGAGQQAHSTRQMIQNYTGMYNLEPSRHHDMLVVGYGAGGRWLLNDEAYNRVYGVTTGNPTRTAVEYLQTMNIRVFMCQNTMRGNGWVSQDLLPGVEMVPAGVVAVIDFASLGYLYAAP